MATCSPPTGSSFPPGVTLVTCTVTDDFADSATCQLQVTVNVAAAPTIAVPAVSRWGLLALVGALALAGVGSLVWKR